MTAPRSAIACLGAGRMGRGIAVAFAYAGHTVTMIDVKSRSEEQFAQLHAEAMAEIKKTLTSLSRFGLLADTEAETIVERITVVSASRGTIALAGAGVVFEGVPEIVDLKREVLGAASRSVGPEVILASTTSTILVDVFRAGNSFFDHPCGLVHGQRLDTRDDEAGGRSTYDGNLADTFEQSFDLRSHPRIGDLPGRNFDERNKVGGIEPMYVEETMRMLDRIGKLID